jgi:PAS domain S-box-containing protein
MSVEPMRARGLEIYRQRLSQIQTDTDRVFFWLLLIQWAIAIVIAIVVSPYAWSGRTRSLHLHVEIAVFGGALLNALPLLLIVRYPGRSSTRQVAAVTQMLWSAMFVHLTGGRIETHFHIFGSIAFLSFYRDPKIILTATAVVAADHLLLGAFWPESVYGIANPEWWRFIEHATWVVFEDVVLLVGIKRALREKRLLSDREAALELAKLDVDRQVTDRTEELKSSGDRYRTLIENTSAVPWELDRATCSIIYVAPQMTSIFGASTEAFIQANDFLGVFHPDDRGPLKRFLSQAPGTRDAADNHIDTRIVGLDGQVTHVRSFVAVQKAGVSPLSVCGISLDITRQKKLEIDLSQAQKLESIGQLSAGIAHEINTPTQFIGDNIRFLQESVREVFGLAEKLGPLIEQSEDPVAKAMLAKILSEMDLDYLQSEVPKAISQSLEGVERIARIVGAMKEFSHPALERTPHDLNRAIMSTITVASNEWKYVAEMVTNLDPSLPPVPVMPGAFNQVILNIIVNAAHAITSASDLSEPLKGRITVSSAVCADWAEIRIKDSGCGIPEAIRNRIFDPFFTTKPVGKGTGQGLAIAHDVIVNKHCGTIVVESQPGFGTTFIIRLPLEPASTDAAQAA